MKPSKFLSLNWLDLAKAFLVALLAFLVNFLQETFIPSLNIPTEVKLMLVTTVGYLVKNLFTKPSTK